MTDSELIELVRQMRAAQKRFFANGKERDVLELAKRLERQVDAAIVDAPAILQVWHKSGYCQKCNQPIAGSLLDLSALKAAIAKALREINND
jgi:hypothetical protein